jgi:hypothetical protein
MKNRIRASFLKSPELASVLPTGERKAEKRGQKIFTPNANNPLKSLDSKK